MPEAGRGYRRRNFFVKQWFQLRYMLLLAVGVLLGGAVYGVVLRYFLRKRLLELMYQSHSVLVNTWQALYPIIFRSTMVLFVVCLALLFVFLRIFAARVGRAAGKVESLSGNLGEHLDGAVEFDGISVKEFNRVGAMAVDMVRFYRGRWEDISKEAGEISELLEKIPEGESGLSPEVDRRLDVLMEHFYRSEVKPNG